MLPMESLLKDDFMVRYGSMKTLLPLVYDLMKQQLSPLYAWTFGKEYLSAFIT
jgi:hypothetical protein